MKVKGNRSQKPCQLTVFRVFNGDFDGSNI